MEVTRPHRSICRRPRNVDVIDAEVDARCSISGFVTVNPQGAAETVEMIRRLRVAMHLATLSGGRAINQIKVITASHCLGDWNPCPVAP